MGEKERSPLKQIPIPKTQLKVKKKPVSFARKSSKNRGKQSLKNGIFRNDRELSLWKGRFLPGTHCNSRRKYKEKAKDILEENNTKRAVIPEENTTDDLSEAQEEQKENDERHSQRRGLDSS